MPFALAKGPGDDRDGMGNRCSLDSAFMSQDPCWADIVDRVRQLLALDDTLDDTAMLASIVEIARFDDPFARVQAAFDSTLGHWLALRGFNLDAALELVVAEIPKPRF